MKGKELLLMAMERAKNFWGNISITQRMIVGALAVIVVAAFIGMMVWLNQTEYDVLYSNLSPEDSSRVVKSLENQQIEFKLADNGQTILVPGDKVMHQRINIAGENLITGQGVGFEMFDHVKVGETDFVQKLNYRRALEGELSRTVGQFPNVESARIHLVIPHRTLFIEEQQSPSASVVLKIRPGQKVVPKDVTAIVNLITMSVEGLDKSKISIADATTGRVLYEPEEEGSISGLTQTQLDHKLLIQRTLERRIEELLTPVTKAGRVVAKVNADLDFSQKTIRREIYDPEQTVVRSEQRSEENTEGSGNVGGVPDPNFRGDGFSGSTSTQAANRETRTTNYEINKEEYNIISNVGGIDRLTVAVVVDGAYEKGEDGNYIFTPKSQDELDNIKQLVANAVGYDSARGDTIEVSSISFGTPEIAPEEGLDIIVSDYAARFGKPLLNTLLVFLFLILVVRPVVLALIRPKVEGKMLEGLEGLPQPEERIAIEDIADEEVEETVVVETLEDIKARVLHLSEQNMDQALNILKGWIKNNAAEGGDKQLPA